MFLMKYRGIALIMVICCIIISLNGPWAESFTTSSLLNVTNPRSFSKDILNFKEPRASETVCQSNRPVFT